MLEFYNCPVENTASGRHLEFKANGRPAVWRGAELNEEN